MNGFLFVACRPGTERWLRNDIAREHPALRSAFVRPGLATFKGPGAIGPDFMPRSPFAHAWGVSLGAAKTDEDIVAAAKNVGARRLHVWEREPDPRREHEPVGALAEAVRARLLAALPEVSAEERAEVGDVVLDVIVGADEPCWLGWHVQDRLRVPWAGGRIPVEAPPELPSRAFRKLAEGLVWSGAPVREGDVVLEFGCSPGGSTLALLQRGAWVVGVDPEPVRAVVVAHGPRFRHVRKSMGGIARADLPDDARWIAMDVSIAPQVALHSLMRFLPPYKRSLLGAFLTLKMNDDAVAADLPKLFDRVRELGFVELRARHLPSNRREIFLYARTALDR